MQKTGQKQPPQGQDPQFPLVHSTTKTQLWIRNDDKNTGRVRHEPRASPRHGEHRKSLKEKTRSVGDTSQKPTPLLYQAHTNSSEHQKAHPPAKIVLHRAEPDTYRRWKTQNPRTYRRWILLEPGSNDKTRSKRKSSFRRRRDQRRSKAGRTLSETLGEKREKREAWPVFQICSLELFYVSFKIPFKRDVIYHNSYTWYYFRIVSWPYFHL